MRIVSWNIQQGGGRRLDGICKALGGWSPDIVTLQEVRAKGVDRLTHALKTAGLTHHFVAPTDTASQNTILIASREGIDAGPFLPDDDGPPHILETETAGLTVLPVHFPQKAAQVPLFEALLTDSESLLCLPALVIGDLNCGLPFEDSSEKTFVNAKYFQALKDAGWEDLYRAANGGDARDFTWISPRTGRGFRYDHALASPKIASRLVSCRYDHTVREAKLADHSALILDLD